MKKYLIRIGDATSQWVNTALGGHPNESLSGRAYRTKSTWQKVIDTILWFDPEHCKVSHLNDVRYGQWIVLNGRGEFE